MIGLMEPIEAKISMGILCWLLGSVRWIFLGLVTTLVSLLVVIWSASSSLLSLSQTCLIYIRQANKFDCSVVKNY